MLTQIVKNQVLAGFLQTMKDCKQWKYYKKTVLWNLKN